MFFFIVGFDESVQVYSLCSSARQSEVESCHVWRAVLWVTPYIRVKRGCAGDKSHNPYTAWRAVLCVTPYIRVKRGCAGNIVQIPTTAWRAVHRDCLADEHSEELALAWWALAKNSSTHILLTITLLKELWTSKRSAAEGKAKERHLKGQSDRAVI